MLVAVQRRALGFLLAVVVTDVNCSSRIRAISVRGHIVNCVLCLCDSVVQRRSDSHRLRVISVRYKCLLNRGHKSGDLDRFAEALGGLYMCCRGLGGCYVCRYSQHCAVKNYTQYFAMEKLLLRTPPTCTAMSRQSAKLSVIWRAANAGDKALLEKCAAGTRAEDFTFEMNDEVRGRVNFT
jgi:hypothetical protein